MSTRKHPPESPRFGTLALATTHRDTRVQTRWLRGGWFDAWHRFWDRASEGELDETGERADGHRAFRMPLPPGTRADGRFHAAADGQMGGIMKVYREWQNGAGDEWLRGLWPSVKKALEYAWKEWDRDKDGVMEGVQHNTYDVEFHRDGLLFSYFEYGGDDFAADMRKMAADPKAREWWKLTNPCQEPLSDRGPGEWWAKMDEVFHCG